MLTAAKFYSLVKKLLCKHKFNHNSQPVFVPQSSTIKVFILKEVDRENMIFVNQNNPLETTTVHSSLFRVKRTKSIVTDHQLMRTLNIESLL